MTGRTITAPREDAMAESRTEVRCQTTDCRGSLGAAIGGRFLPAGHIYATRDLWVDDDGRVLVRCRLCNHWYHVQTGRGRVRLTAEAVSATAGP